MATPDLEALTGAVERLSAQFPSDDPIFQQVVETSVCLAEAFLDRMDGDDEGVLDKLRALQA